MKSLDPKNECLNARIESLNPNIESLNSRIESLNPKIKSLNPKVEPLNPNLASFWRYYNTGKHLRLCYLNARSLKNKSADFVCYALSTGADIFAITETWFTEDDMTHRAEITLPGYKLLAHPRVGRTGGGIALLFRENIQAKRVDSGERKSFEFSEWILQYCSTKLRLIIVYRTPYSTAHSICVNVFLEEFSLYLESVIMSSEPLLIVGDFNLHVNIPSDPNASKFVDLLSSMGLDQHVDKPTHVSGNTLDLRITRCSDSLVPTNPLIDYLLSDHMTILCDIMLGKPPPITKKVTYRKIKAIDKKKLCVNTPDALNQLVECYNRTLSQALDRHAPICTKSIKSRPLVPWFNEKIKAARREKRKAERKWRRTRSLDDTNRLMNEARTQFYHNFIEENNTNQKNLFTAVNKLLNQSNERSVFPQFIDKQKFAGQMGSYFVSKIQDIHTKPDISAHSLPKDTVDNSSITITHLDNFTVLTEEEVLQLVKGSTKKSCNLDLMPTPLVIDCIDVYTVADHHKSYQLVFGVRNVP